MHQHQSSSITKKRKTVPSKPQNNAGSTSPSTDSNPPSASSNPTNPTSNTHKQPVKRIPACDLCRARKVKCVKNPSAESCEGCVALNQKCEYTRARRKPGPANSFARKVTPPRHYIGLYPPIHSSRSTTYSLEAHSRGYSDSSRIGASYPESTLRQPSSTSFFSPSIPFPSGVTPSTTSHPSHFDLDSSWTQSDPLAHPNASTMRTLDVPFLPISPNTLLYPIPGEVESSDGSPAGTPWSWANAGSSWDATDGGGVGYSVGGWDPGPSAYSASGPSTGAPETPSLRGMRRMGSDGQRSDRGRMRGGPSKPRRLEDVLEWSTMMRILHAYHAHLFPLMPIVHWPSFSQQLIAREDELSETWRAFLLSLVAYSIIQLPRSALTFLPVAELRKMHQRCHSESRKLQNRRYASVALVDIQTLYCQHIYLGTLGKTHAANVTLAESIRLSHVLVLHDERVAPPSLDVVEREMRRRTFWLLYGSDRTIAALTSDPMHMDDADLCIPLPLSLDDNLLTPSGAFPQSPGIIPVLAGFHFNSRLLRLLGAVMTTHRAFAASWHDPNLDPFPVLALPPSPHTWVRPAHHFFDELERILAELPGPLQLVNPSGGEPTSNGRTSTQEDGKDGQAFATCRANLLITQALVRFAIRLYGKAVGEPDAGDPGRDWAEKDVLSLLESMSPESLAANGDSLRMKVLFVASSLLEKYPSTAEGHNYVSDFMAVYNRISQEQHSSLLEPGRSGDVSREMTPLPVGGPKGVRRKV